MWYTLAQYHLPFAGHFYTSCRYVFATNLYDITSGLLLFFV
jgi:hypothetical protein